MNQFVDWVKANVFIVIFVVVMIAAPVAMFFVASGMNAGVRTEVGNRAKRINDLNSLPTELPNGERGLVTDDLLTKYKEAIGKLGDDAEAVRKEALQFNRKDHKPLMPDVFPEPPFAQREVIEKQFHERLVAAYDALLADTKAGSPPDLESLREKLEGMRNRFITQDLKKDINAPLDPEEDKRLKEMLSEARLAMYREEAARVGVYASADVLMVPSWDQSRLPSPAQMFNWQWQYWIVEDVLAAVKRANDNSQSVMDAPVKQVLGVVVRNLPAVAAEVEGSETPPPSGRSGFGDPGMSAMPPPGGGNDMTAPMGGAGGSGQRDYSASFTGLVSNDLFDVVPVDLGLIVETARLPEVLDALSRFNFMTITNLRIEPTDAFAATERGLYYGAEPVCSVTMTLETVWLRKWTEPFMPKGTRTALGIAPDAGPSSDSAEGVPPVG